MNYSHLISFIVISVILGISRGAQTCESDIDCMDEAATCVDTLCQCDIGYIFNTDETRCLSHSIGYKAVCEEDIQCSWLIDNYHCNSGVCDCESGYRYLNGYCVISKSLGESCTSNGECHVTNDLFAMICSNRICVCNDGYYSRGDYDCRPEGTSLNDICALDSDCKIENATCNTYQCLLEGNGDDEVDTSDDENDIEDDTILDDENDVEDDTILNDENDVKDDTLESLDDTRTVYVIGTSCTDNEGCEDVENSICSTLINQCICDRGYFYDESYGCVGEIGMDVGCTEDTDCSITTDRCVEGACVCPLTHYYNDDLTKCIRVAYSPLFPCTDQISCHILSKDANCQGDSESTSYCSCPTDYLLNSHYVCRDYCDIDEDCSSPLNSICSDGSCICPDNFRLEGDTCLPNLGSECDDVNKICEMENSVCSEGNVCVCDTDYVAVNELLCVESLSGLHDDCDYDIQCSDVIDYSECILGTCQCPVGFTERDSQCYGIPSSSVLDCDVNSDCIDAAVCLNGLCECDIGYVFSLDGMRCLPNSIGYGASCEDDSQCSWLMGKHYCNSGVCDCESGYRYLNSFCVISKGLGESCTRNEECHVTNDLFAMTCSDGVCGCSDGYYARGDYDCRPEGTSLNDTCALDSDCKVENTYCYIYQCIEKEADEDDDEDGEDDTIEPAYINGITTYEIGTSCSVNDDCGDVENSICSRITRQCICKRGYYYDASYGCLGEIGTDVGCVADSDCRITPRKCVDGACVCPLTHYHNSDLTKCIRVAYSPLFACTDNIACHIYAKDAYCVSDADGIFSYCSCPLNYELNEDFVCVTDGSCQTNTCVVDDDCDNLNAVCTDNLCGCPNNFRLEDDICLPNIGGECDDGDKVCEIENASCSEENVCACDTGYTAVDGTTCHESLGGLHDDCEYDPQCDDIVLNSECLGGTCQCSTGFVEKDSLCQQPREYGAYCDRVEQCTVLLGPNIQCRNSYCQCAADQAVTADGLDCQDKSSTTKLEKSVILLVLNVVIFLYA